MGFKFYRYFINEKYLFNALILEEFIFMKKIFFLFLFSLFYCFSANASHIYGGDINYKSIGGNTYEISLILYGDCSGASYPNLFSSSPVIEIYNNGSFFQNISLAISGNPGLEVTPVCPAQANNTTCQGGTQPGVAQFIFKKQISLNAQSSNWRFIFNGNLGAGGAGRSASITNISANGANASVMQLEATLNNSLAPNNSATYSTIPTPFFCINTQQEYNQGAIDADGDLLTFDLVDGLDANSPSGLVNYIPPYSYNAPLGTTSGNFLFNNSNGQMSFMPNIQQQALVVSKVTETRNGIIVGTSMREMTFVVLNTCNNQSPSGFITNANTGNIVTQEIIEACNIDNSVLSFSIQAVDPNGDKITATVNGLPANAVSTITNNNSTNPMVNISFTMPTPFVAGNYSFYVTYQDDACPLSSKQTLAYTIKLVQPITAIFQISNESCFPKNDGKINVNGTTTNNTLFYSINNGAFQTSNSFINLTAGNYSIVLKDDKNCLLKTQATVLGSLNPTIVNPIVKNIKCFGEKNGSITVSATPISSNYIYTLFPNNIFNNTGLFTGLSQNNYTVLVQDNSQCRDSFMTSISEPPPIQLTSLKTYDLYCDKINGKIIATSNFADSVYYFLEPGIGRAENGIYENLQAGTYTLSIVNNNGCTTQQVVMLNTLPKTLYATTTQNDLPCNGNGTEGFAEVFANNGTPPYSYVWTTNPIQTNAKATDLYFGWYHVTVTDATGCDVKTQVYINAGNCCENIFAANVFTPNGDNKNDDWGLVTSAGLEIKQFMVVNRWGQKVWETENQRTRWDGRQKTRIVDPGTYYYLLKYKCLTDNKTYIKKGEVNVVQ